MKYITVFFLIVSLASCKEKIDFDLNDEDFTRIVVEGIITDQTKEHLVKLTWTSSYYENQVPDPVTGATVTISDGSVTWPLAEEPANSGMYYTADDVSGTVGAVHTLTIDYEGEVYEGSEMMRPVAELESIELVAHEEQDEDEVVTNYEILVWTQEPAGTVDFYRWRILVNDVSRNDSLSALYWSDDALYDGTYLDGYSLYDLDEVSVGDMVTLEQMSITQEASEIFTAMSLETLWRGGLFDSAPANIQTNMGNGALGFFGASSVSSKTVVVTE